MSSFKKCCKVCKDSGKSEQVYSSHFPRESSDPNSKVICPTLLAMECRGCGKKGHTIKYCRNSKPKEKEREKREPVVVVVNSKYNNKFDCLKKEKKEPKKEKEEIKPNKITYASVLKTEKEKPCIVMMPLEKKIQPRQYSEPKNTLPETYVPIFKIKKNWAEDYEDDDEEYHYNEEYHEEEDYEEEYDENQGF